MRPQTTTPVDIIADYLIDRLKRRGYRTSIFSIDGGRTCFDVGITECHRFFTIATVSVTTKAILVTLVIRSPSLFDQNRKIALDTANPTAFEQVIQAILEHHPPEPVPYNQIVIK